MGVSTNLSVERGVGVGEGPNGVGVEGMEGGRGGYEAYGVVKPFIGGISSGEGGA